MMEQTHMQMNWLQWAMGAGLTDVIPVIPVGAVLREGSRVDVKQLGKVPGWYEAGGWDSFAGWPEIQMDAQLAARFDQLGANAGLKCGYQTVALDVDIKDDLTMQAVRAALVAAGVKAPVRVGEAPKALWLFRVSGEPIRRRQYPIKQLDSAGQAVLDTDGKPIKAVVDVMGVSRTGRPTQCVIAGSHPSGSMYTWDRDFTANDLPTVTQERMDELVQIVLGVTDDRGWARGRPSAAGGSGLGRKSDLDVQPNDLSLVGDVMGALENPDYTWDDWVRIGLCLCTVLGHDEGWPHWLAFSQRSDKFDPVETEERWDSFEPTGDMTFGTLIQYVRDQGVVPLDLDARLIADAKWRGALRSGMPEAPTGTGLPVAGAAYVDGLPAGGGAVAGASASAGAAKMPTPENEPMPEDGRDYVRKTDGTIIPCFENVDLWITTDERWRNCFAYDAFADKPVVLSPLPGGHDNETPRPLTDNDYLTTRGWFQRNGFVRIAKSDIQDAIDHVSVRNSFEPVQSYLKGLSGEQTGLIDTWLHRFIGVVETGDVDHDHYVSQIGRKWLISAVARAMRPGCQADHALVFEGPQGAGKSSALRALCPEEDWFGDSLPDFHSKDASEYLNGVWIVEMSELASMRKAELEDMRSFLTRRIENYVPKYVRRTVYRPRRCVFAGSTNRDDYLKDAAGERRIWPVRVGTVDVDGLKSVRNALWREAYVAFMMGEGWHLDPSVSAHATQLQRERVEVDPWQDMISDQILHLPEVTPMLIYRIMGLPADKWSQRESRRISGILTALGYSRNGRITSGEFRMKPRWVKNT